MCSSQQEVADMIYDYICPRCGAGFNDHSAYTTHRDRLCVPRDAVESPVMQRARLGPLPVKDSTGSIYRR